MLEPYWPAIQKARAGGYTLDQIVGFLQNNSVNITRSGLFAFIKRREARGDKNTLVAPSQNIAQSTSDTKNTTATPNTQVEIKAISPAASSRKASTPKDIAASREVEINLDDYQDHPPKE